MCGCRKNKGLTAPAPAPPRSRSLVVPARPLPVRRPPVAVVPVQKREVIVIRHRRRLAYRSISLFSLEVLDTAVWGPSLWKILHTAAEATEPNAAAAPLLEKTIRALDGALPCPDCRKHYHTWLQTHPVSGDLRTWLLDLHNDVNVRTGKVPWTVDDLAAAYGSGEGVTAALETLRSRIGVDGWRALHALVKEL